MSADSGARRSSPAAPIRLTPQAWHQLTLLAGRPPEGGGLLGSRGGGVVDRLWLDRRGQTAPGSYTPDTASINRLVLPAWRAGGIAPAGFLHSHPPDCPALSGADAAYARRLLRALGVRRLLMPLLCGDGSGAFFLRGYTVRALSGGGMRLRRCRVLPPPLHRVPARRAQVKKTDALPCASDKKEKTI